MGNLDLANTTALMGSILDVFNLLRDEERPAIGNHTPALVVLTPLPPPNPPSGTLRLPELPVSAVCSIHQSQCTLIAVKRIGTVASMGNVLHKGLILQEREDETINNLYGNSKPYDLTAALNSLLVWHILNRVNKKSKRSKIGSQRNAQESSPLPTINQLSESPQPGTEMSHSRSISLSVQSLTTRTRYSLVASRCALPASTDG
ncbi:hypothetical protein J6590_032251 [Homalodisca vitripennis]|nr:hypothetical protein J6590_032251 [Homalodisca vitripennis]